MSIGKIIKVLVCFGVLITQVLAHFTDLPLSLPGLKIPSDLNVAVLQIENFTDWIYASLYVLIFYTFKFLALGGVLEMTNPIPKTNYRTYMMKKQIKYGVCALLIVVSFTTLFFWKVEPLMPYYGYYATHAYGLKEFLMNVIVYMFCFDTWFWFTHVMFHNKFFWEHVHMMHHQFLEPTAFGQDAVHPLEALVQGPFGHFLCALFYPMHPIAHAVFGLLTSAYAIFAHDGRWDLNTHLAHHQFVEVNYGLYWGFWDFVFGTRYNKAKHGEYKPTWERPDKGESLLKSIQEKDKSD